jgi:tetratricopeptide (TPR) repeat protein
LIDIGAPLAERLLFQASIGFSFVICYYLLKVPGKFSDIAFYGFTLVIVTFSVKTVTRNSEWESNYTLFTTDVEACPNSVRTNLFAGQQCLTLANTETDKIKRMDYYRRAVFYDERILSIHPHYRFIHEDLGYAYFGLGNYFKAAEYWGQAYKLDESNKKLKDQMTMLSDVMYNSGNRKFRQNEIDSAIVYFETAIDLNPQNGDAWYNLGGSYFSVNDVKNGVEAWQIAYTLSPNHSFNRDQFPARR